MGPALRFSGFKPPEPITHVLPLPQEFFTELLTVIHDVTELKTILAVIYVISLKADNLRTVSFTELLKDSVVQAVLASRNASSPPFAQVLRRALNAAVEHGALVRGVRDKDELYAANSPKGRRALGESLAGPAKQTRCVAESAEGPTIFTLYEDNIGELTPLIVDELTDLESAYPAGWILDAFRVAVTAEKRSLRYIARILERWKDEGKENVQVAPELNLIAPETSSGHSREEPPKKRYVPEGYENLIIH